MMRKVFTVVLGIACVAVLYFGQSYWKQQISASSKNSSESNREGTIEKNRDEDFVAYTKNWPEAAVNRFKQTVEEDTAFRVLFVGSPAIADSFDVVKREMSETYGKSVVLELQTSELTSAQFIEEAKHEAVAAEKADIVVIEPFLLIDNGEVGIEESLANLSLFIEEIQTANPEAVVIIQPSYPLYNARFYPVQVDGLKTFAEENQLTYLDHWSAWPDPKTEEIIEYLNEDQTAPSEKGLQVWSDYLQNYLINNESASN